MGFQAYGGVPGEDFDMENSILRSKNLDSDLQRPKIRKTEIRKKYKLYFFGFLVITRNQSDVYGPDLVEIDPRSLPQLSKRLRDLNFSQKPGKTELQNFEQN